MTIPCTLGILTHNSGHDLARCLESAKGFSDIVLADGGSTDETLEIARRYGCRVIAQSNPGTRIIDFAKERNRLLDASKEKWFFYLDSDETISTELLEDIRKISTNANTPEGLFKVRYLKTNEDFSRIYRTYREYYQIRLLRTDIGARFIRPVHERIDVPAGSRVGQLEGPWYVPLDSGDLSVSGFSKKAWVRTKITASSWRPRGTQDIFFHLFVEPAISISKSLYKMIAVRFKWGRDAIPLRYELLRIVYAFFLGIRYWQAFLGKL